MGLRIYDTLRRETVPFETREPGTAYVYVCGPTVYGDAHIGHGRFAVVFDVLRRWLTYCGTDVTFVVNITDVDDKIIDRANREGVSASLIADRFTRRWNASMDAVGVLPPDIQPHATAHIGDMQELIGRLIADGMAYESDGNVLFRVREYAEYGKLSGRRIEDAQQPADVPEVTKDDPIDFALWKAAKPGEPSWPSPWGPGRPGWHIECSAMAGKHLGTPIDLHGGGVDLVFPHHENEIAQHEAGTGGTFSRHWMHNGMLRMADAKMARSIGNVVSIDAAVTRWGRGPVRLWYCSAAYRSPLTFDDDLLDESSIAFQRLLSFVRNARLCDADPDASVAEPHRERFHGALDDDLNLPAGVAVLHGAAHEGNEFLKRADGGDADAQAAVVALGELVAELADDVLGLGIDDVLRASEELGRRFGPVVEELLDRRAAARSERDFETADRIRDLLADAGVTVEDRPGGARWYIEPRIGSEGDGQLASGTSGSLPTAEI